MADVQFFELDQQFFMVDLQFFATGLLLAYKLCIFFWWTTFILEIMVLCHVYP